MRLPERRLAHRLPDHQAADEVLDDGPPDPRRDPPVGQGAVHGMQQVAQRLAADLLDALRHPVRVLDHVLLVELLLPPGQRPAAKQRGAHHPVQRIGGKCYTGVNA